jgi:hypothetical protein
VNRHGGPDETNSMDSYSEPEMEHTKRPGEQVERRESARPVDVKTRELSDKFGKLSINCCEAALLPKPEENRIYDTWTHCHCPKWIPIVASRQMLLNKDMLSARMSPRSCQELFNQDVAD